MGKAFAPPEREAAEIIGALADSHLQMRRQRRGLASRTGSRAELVTPRQLAPMSKAQDAAPRLRTQPSAAVRVRVGVC